MDPASDHTLKILPVSFELFRSTVFSPRRICLIHPSPFQISPRERPPHLPPCVHRSLAKSTVADWSSSKKRSSSGPFDFILRLPGQGETAEIPLISYCAQSTPFCDKRRRLNPGTLDVLATVASHAAGVFEIPLI